MAGANKCFKPFFNLSMLIIIKPNPRIGKILFATSTYTPYGEYITNTEKRPIKSQLRLTDLTWEYIFGKVDGYMEKKNDIYKRGAESWNIYDLMKVVK